MTPTFQRAYPPATPRPGLVFWLPFQKDKLLVEQREQGVALIQRDEEGMAALQPQAIMYIGTLDAVPCLACEVSPEITLPPGWRALNLRELFGQIDDVAYGMTGFASQLLYWQRNSHYCPVCGSPMGELTESWGRHCTHCNYMGYPPVIPAILVLVHNGEHVLLAHKPGWGKRYSIIAGFVEPGESLEQCVQREVQEEVSVNVTDITYIGSQSWPFPQQLMVGFTARYVGGEVRPDYQELDDAKWFRYDALPELPPRLSLSRQIINGWVASQQSKEGQG